MRPYKLFGFIKKCFCIGLEFLSTLTSVNLLGAALLSCISMKNQEHKVRPQIVNSEEPVFFPFSIKRSKCKVTISIIDIQNCVFLGLLKI